MLLFLQFSCYLDVGLGLRDKGDSEKEITEIALLGLQFSCYLDVGLGLRD